MENVQGWRRQPGPPPTLKRGERGEGIWSNEVSTGHHQAAKEHGFASGLTRASDYIDAKELALLWIDLLLLRGMASLEEGN